MLSEKISITIKKEDDLYNDFDRYNATLSEDLLNYLDEKIDEISEAHLLKLEIITPKDIDIDNFIKIFKRGISKKIAKNKKIIRTNNLKKLKFLLLGLIFISLSSFFINHANVLIGEIFSIVGSFAIWEMTDLIIVGDKNLKVQNMNYERIKNSKISVRMDNNE